MRYLHAIPFLLAVSLASCLLPAPSPKENIRPVEFGQSAPGGDLGRRIGASLRLLSSAYGDPDRLTADSTGSRSGDALLGSVLMSRAAGAGREQADRVYKAIAARFEAPGYFTGLSAAPLDEQVLAGHGVVVRALCEYYLWTGQSGALDMAETICDSLFVPALDLIAAYPLDSAGRAVPDTTGIYTATPTGWRLDRREPGSIFRAAEGIAQLYGLRKGRGSGKLMEEFVSLYNDAAASPAGLSAAAYLSGARALLRYGETQGAQDYSGEAEKAWERFRELSLNEFYSASPVMGDTSVHYCPDVSSGAYITAMRLWVLTGKGDYLEDAERIFYNGLLSAQSPDGGFTGIMAGDSTGKLYRCTADSCGCDALWAEGLASAVRFSYFVRDNKVLIPFYCEGELVVEQKGLHIIQTTDYPLGRTVRLEVADAPKRGIGLQVFFPSYMTVKSMTLNGSMTISGTVNSVGLLEFRDVFRKGDIIDIHFSFASKWTAADARLGKDFFKGTYGPLVLGYESGTPLWLERGVTLRHEEDYDFMLDDELSYRRDTVTGMVDVLTVMSGADISGTQYYEPPVLKPLYRPFSEHMQDVFPEYVIVRIGKE